MVVVDVPTEDGSSIENITVTSDDVRATVLSNLAIARAMRELARIARAK